MYALCNRHLPTNITRAALRRGSRHNGHGAFGDRDSLARPLPASCCCASAGVGIENGVRALMAEASSCHENNGEECRPENDARKEMSWHLNTCNHVASGFPRQSCAAVISSASKPIVLTFLPLRQLAKRHVCVSGSSSCREANSMVMKAPAAKYA